LRAIKKLIRNIILLNKINSSLWIYLNYFKSFLKSYYVSKKNFDNVVKFKKFISNKSFSTDWTSTNIPFWCEYLKFSNFNTLNIIEIGSWEGLTTNFINFYFPNAKIVCIDSWEGSDEHKLNKYNQSSTEKLFDKNNSNIDIKKYKMKSSDFFKRRMHILYDLIYIDGSHFYKDVLNDCINSFKILKLNGYLILDDYFWVFYKNINDNPASAINFFLKNYKSKFKIIHLSDQVILKKISH